MNAKTTKETTLKIINTHLIHSANGLGSSDKAGDEWPMFRAALNHTGVATTTPMQGTGPTWNYKTGLDVESSPAIVGGRLYVGSRDCKVYCLNATTGVKLWSYTTGKSVDSSPAVASGRVYVGSNDNHVYCLDAITGAFIWSYTTGDWVTSSPALAGERVYVGSYDGNLYCLNAISGAVIWFYSMGSNAVQTSPAVAGGRVYVGGGDDTIHCLNATTGAFIWSYTTGGWMASSPAVAGGRVYVGSCDGKLYCFNATSGNSFWSYTIGVMIKSSPAVIGGRVYVGSSNNYFYCLNAITGAFIWSYNAYYVESSPAVASGFVYVGSQDCSLHCLNATTGTRVWCYATGNLVQSSPAIAGGHVYVGSLDGRVYCLPMILSLSTPATVPSAPSAVTATTGNCQVVLNWAAPVSDGGSAITNYNLYRGKSSGNEMYYTTVCNITMAYIDSNVTSGQNYYYKISAVNAIGEGMSSNEASATPVNESNPGSSNKTDDEWPMFRGNLNNTGTVITTPVQGTRSAWNDNIDCTDTPAVVGGLIYVGGKNLYCLNATTGAFVWSYAINVVESSPAIADGRVYVGSGDGRVCCLNAITGSFIWSYTTGYQVLSSPAVAGGLVYVGSRDHNIYCLNATTGALAWSFITSQMVDSSPAVAGGRVYVGSEDGNVYCLNATTGTKIWKYTTGAAVDSSPAIANGRVYVGSEDGNLYCLNAITGAFIWSYNTHGCIDWSSPAVSGGRVYVGSYNNKVYCLNAITGAFAWSYTTGSEVWCSPTVSAGYMYVADSDGEIYCLNIVTGTLVWNYTTRFIGGSSFAVAGGYVYAYYDKVYCFPMIIMPPTVPTASKSFTATPGYTQVTLTWSAPASNGGSAITGYRIFQGTAPGNETLLATIGNVLTYTSTGLANGQVYYFEVAAMNSVGTGVNSTETSATPQVTVPSAPRMLTAMVESCSVALYWAAPVSDGGSGSEIVYYKIYRGTSSGNEMYYTTVINITMAYIDLNVTIGQIYYYKISAVNDVGEGMLSSESSAMLNVTIPVDPVISPLNPSDTGPNFMIELFACLIAIGSVMSVSTVTMARKIKAKHQPPSSTSTLVTTRTRIIPTPLVCKQPDPMFTAAAQVQLATLPSSESSPRSDDTLITIQDPSFVIPEATCLDVSASEDMNPEITSINDSTSGIARAGFTLLVRRVDLHWQAESDARIQKNQVAIWCKSCGVPEDAKPIPVDERISYYCRKCHEPMVMTVECPACFGKLTIDQDNLSDILDKGTRCPVCRELVQLHVKA